MLLFAVGILRELLNTHTHGNDELIVVCLSISRLTTYEKVIGIVTFGKILHVGPLRNLALLLCGIVKMHLGNDCDPGVCAMHA